MRTVFGLSRIAAGCLGLLCAWPLGCATSNAPEQDRLVDTAPTREELPDLTHSLERSIAAKVAVEGATDRPRLKLTPDFKEPPLTDEERELLGEQEPEKDDLLAFYQPPGGPERGVAPWESGPHPGINGVGGPLLGLSPVFHNIGVHGVVGYYFGVSELRRSAASTYNEPRRPAAVNAGNPVRIGEGPARRPAERMPRIDN